jgi:hypothetical protein
MLSARAFSRISISKTDAWLKPVCLAICLRSSKASRLKRKDVPCFIHGIVMRIALLVKSITRRAKAAAVDPFNREGVKALESPRHYAGGFQGLIL